MRDGNTETFPGRSGAASCLKPTYEGWKPSVATCRQVWPLGLKPTYEGWKHLFVVDVFNLLFVFEAYL